MYGCLFMTSPDHWSPGSMYRFFSINKSSIPVSNMVEVIIDTEKRSESCNREILSLPRILCLGDSENKGWYMGYGTCTMFQLGKL